jgi:F-type H+-transporting ATPase subunit f
MSDSGFFLIFSPRQSGGSGEGLSPLVNFYSKLPKGPAPSSPFGGIKARFFNGKNASSLPLWSTIFGLFALGYTIDYQS